MKPEDKLLVYMVGHTGARGGHSYYDTVGAKLADTDLAKALDEFKRVEITLVMSPCQAEGFIWQCGAPGRVVLVSTRIDEGNSAGVAEAFIRGVESGEWDADKDGRNSMWEAYRSVVQEQTTWWEKRGSPQGEHALLDDNGDRKGHYLPEGEGGDGEVARRRFLGDEGRPLKVSKEALARLAKQNRALKLED
jgi:hypothetical protein